MVRWLMLVLVCLLAAIPVQAQRSARQPRPPVNTVAPGRLDVGGGLLPLYVSQDWSKPLPGITRAVLVLHGVLRNADRYYQTALDAQTASGPAGASSLMIAPQFLQAADIAANGLPPAILRWGPNQWEGGGNALAPVPASSFEALDAILRTLANRALFPNLRTVVVAGHSGGAQVVQRYAIAGKAEPALAAEGIAVRYVVANPSSYAYFDAWRPVQSVAQSCPGVNDWKYGMQNRPPYLAMPTPAALLANYTRRDVVYLLGAEDTNPNQPALDKSCMGEAQGPYRLARGHAYVDHLGTIAGPALHQKTIEIPGVGHDGKAMLTSACGLAALFGGGCGLP